MASRLLQRFHKSRIHLIPLRRHVTISEEGPVALAALANSSASPSLASLIGTPSTSPSPPYVNWLRFGVAAATATVTATACGTSVFAYADASPSAQYPGTASASSVHVSDDEFEGLASEIPATSVTEKLSDVPFPVNLSDTEVLAGASCRLMRQLVKVYAIGMYVNRDQLQKCLSRWQLFTSRELGDASAFWQQLCGRGIDKTFRLVVVREVPGKHMAAGFERALLPRVTEFAGRGGGSSASTGRPPSVLKGVVKSFCRGFVEVGNMKVGSVALLQVRGNTCSLVIDGRVMRVVEDESLVWALCDMYLGDDGVVAALRGELVDGISTLLKN